MQVLLSADPLSSLLIMTLRSCSYQATSRDSFIFGFASYCCKMLEGLNEKRKMAAQVLESDCDPCTKGPDMVSMHAALAVYIERKACIVR